jgi:hypothetical protein
MDVFEERVTSTLKIEGYAKRATSMNDITSYVSCSAYSAKLKMEAICSSETSVGFQRTIQRKIPEERTLHNHRFEDVKSYMATLSSTILMLVNKE